MSMLKEKHMNFSSVVTEIVESDFYPLGRSYVAHPTVNVATYQTFFLFIKKKKKWLDLPTWAKFILPSVCKESYLAKIVNKNEC